MARERVIPLLTSAPHDSDNLHSFRNGVSLSPWQIGEMSDAHTGQTVFNKDAIGNVKSIAHRALGDLNRARSAGDVFPTLDFRGNKIWEVEPSQKEKELLLLAFYDPYYDALHRLIQTAPENGFKKVILWDNHDTGDYNTATGLRDRKLKGEERKMPMFVISNFGLPHSGEIDYAKFEDPTKGFITAPSELMIELQGLIAAEFSLGREDVEINTSMKGGGIIQHHGNPEYPSGVEVWAFQVEYNRGLIMDQATRIPYLDRINEFNEKFNSIASDLAQNPYYSI